MDDIPNSPPPLNPKEFHLMLSEVQLKLNSLVVAAALEPIEAPEEDEEDKSRHELINNEAEHILKKELLKSVDTYLKILKIELALDSYKEVTFEDVVKKKCKECEKCPEKETPSIVGNGQLTPLLKKVITLLQVDVEQLDKLSVWIRLMEPAESYGKHFSHDVQMLILKDIMDINTGIRNFLKDIAAKMDSNPRFSSFTLKDVKDHPEWTVLLDRINSYEFELHRRSRDFVHKHHYDLVILRNRINKNLSIMTQMKTDNHEHIYR